MAHYASSKPGLLQVLPTRVYHACIHKDNLQKCAFTLMKLFLFPPKENTFFHFTHTQEEISLILPEELLTQFPPHTLTLVDTPWRPLSLETSYGQGLGYVSHMSNILARAKVSIYYLSTAQNDFILVQERDLHTTITVLKEQYAVEHYSKIPPSTLDFGTIQQAVNRATDNSIVMHKPQPHLQCKLLQKEMHFCSLSKENRGNFSQSILKIAFFSDPSMFFSFTETEDELSLLLEANTLNSFSQEQREALTPSPGYRPLQRFEKTSLGEVGVISALSKPIAQAKIPLLYLSTYHSAYIMVPIQDVSMAKICLENAGYRVTGTPDDENSNLVNLEPVPKKETTHHPQLITTPASRDNSHVTSLSNDQSPISDDENRAVFGRRWSTTTMEGQNFSVSPDPSPLRDESRGRDSLRSSGGVSNDDEGVTVMLHYPSSDNG